jgi:SGNH hydrolase-like domain, acetyltransferase AlgX
MSGKKKWLGRLANLSLLVVSLVVTLVAAEYVLRFTDVGVIRSGVWSPPHPMQTDSLGRRVFRPGYIGQVTSQDFQFDVRGNSEGFRERELPTEPSDAQDLLFLGDSFFFGHGVNREHRFSERLPALLGAVGLDEYRGWNLSHPGGDTRDEIRTLEAFHDRFGQVHVFLGFFVGNDFVYRDPADGQTAIRIDPSNNLRSFLRTSRLFNVVSNSLWSFRTFRDLFNLMEMKNDRVVIYELDGGARQDHIYNATEDVLVELATFCQSNGLALTVVLIPDHLQVLFPEAYEDLDLLKPQRRLTRALSAHGVPVIDLFDTFAREPDPSALMFTRDKHWNEQGHHVVAEEIARYLADGPSS